MQLYEILGIDKNASREEIKRAYREKAKKHHPDKGGSGFENISTAYAILSDNQKREYYDTTGKIDEKSSRDKRKNDLMNLFNYYIENNSSEYLARANIPKDLKRRVGGKISEVENDIFKEKKVEKKISNLKGRLKKKEGNNLFEALLSQRTKYINKNILNLKEEIKSLKLLYDLIGEYQDTASHESGYMGFIEQLTTIHGGM